MKRLCFILGLILGFGVLNVQATEVQKVAVYVTGGDDDGIKQILGDQLVAAFTGSGRYIAVERTGSFLAELRKEQYYQQTGAVDDRELSRLGIQFGVQFVCVVKINEAFGSKYVSSRLIDVESAEVVNTASETSGLKDMNELLQVCKKLAAVLTGKTEKEKIAEKIAAQEAAEKQAKAQEEERKTKVAERLARVEEAKKRGYIIVDNLMVSYPPVRSIDWKAAMAMAESKGYGWSLPTMEQARRISSYIYSELGGGLVYGDNYNEYCREFSWAFWTTHKCRSVWGEAYYNVCGWGKTECVYKGDRHSAVIVKEK